MARNASRPMSPHLFDRGLRLHWRWGPHMLVSILHRVTGGGLTIAGGIILVWWLTAAATSAEAYATFLGQAKSWYGLVVLIGLSWALFQHTCSGLRHLVMDIGAGFELNTNKMWANATIVLSILLTAALWLYILGVRGW